MAFCEVSQDQSPGTPAAAGDFGFKVLTSSDPAEKTKKLSAELANGRLAMMAIIGMFFQAGFMQSNVIFRRSSSMRMLIFLDMVLLKDALFNNMLLIPTFCFSFSKCLGCCFYNCGMFLKSETLNKHMLYPL